MIKKICKCCGQPFWTDKITDTYCCEEHRGKRLCKKCGKPHSHRHYGQISDYCLSCDPRSIRLEDYKKPNKPRPKTLPLTKQGICKVCGVQTSNSNNLCTKHQYVEGNVWQLQNNRWIEKFPTSPMPLQSAN